MSQPPRILLIDADTAFAQKVGLALDGAGFPVTWCSFSPSEVNEGVRDFRPTLLVVRAEPSAPQLAALLARLEATPLPVALLCKDQNEARFVSALRTGVVELFQEPFNARTHGARLRQLLEEIPQRDGEISGRGARELGELVQHVMRSRRTGGLEVSQDGGRAFFVRGVLKAARLRDFSQETALAAMLRSDKPWTFAEASDGSTGVVEFMGADEPAAAEPGLEPLSEGPAVPGLEEATPSFVAPTPVIDADTERTSILFVDDDPAVVVMLSGYFSKKGYPVATAADGLEAIKLMTSRSFEMVIADLNMPGLDGWGLLRLIREDLRTHETPVALFSAQDNYRESLRLQHAGAQAYFPKTLRLSALELQVRELCEPRRRFIRLIPSDGGLEFNFGSLGPQWTLKALTLAGFSGQLDARDSWATWRLWFELGRLVQVNSRVGPTGLEGDRALASFLTSKHAEGSLSRGTQATDEGFAGHSTAATLSRLVPWLNDERKRAAEGQLARARALEVNDELYRLFLAVGPPAWQPIVRLLCEEKCTPAEVISRLSVAPAEVAAVVRELLRRGVASLAA